MKIIRIKLYIIVFFILIITICSLGSYECLAVGVRPLVIDMDIKPGFTKEFQLNMIHSDKEEVVQLSLYKIDQSLTGKITYKKIIDNESIYNWVSLSEKEVKVMPYQENIVKGVVKVPFDARGSQTIVIMVEKKRTPKTKGVSFILRYAVRLNIRINRPGLRKRVELDQIKLESGVQGQPIIETIINNQSSWDFLISGEANIRDQNRKLVEKIKLRCPVNIQSDKIDTRVYPRSRIKFLGEIRKKLKPGKYNIHVFFRYGEHGQIIENKEIEIKEGQFNFPRADEIGVFSVDHERINLKLKPGERKTIPLKLQSEIGEDSVIVVESKDIESDYKYSNQEWLKLFNADQVNLRGRMSNRVVTSALVPRDVEDGSYNGVLLIKAFNPETEELLEVEEIPVSILVGEKHNPSVKMRSVLSNKVEEGYLLSVDILNSGNISIKPGAEVIIKNENDEFVERVELSTIEDEELIIPLMPGQLTGIASNLGEGEYKLEITVFNNEDEIKKFEETIVIK